MKCHNFSALRDHGYRSYDQRNSGFYLLFLWNFNCRKIKLKGRERQRQREKKWQRKDDSIGGGVRWHGSKFNKRIWVLSLKRDFFGIIF